MPCGLLIGLAVALALWVLAIAVLVALGRRSQARELMTLIPNLVVLFRGLLGDPRVSRRSKAWLWFALAWLVSPVDLIPEFIPIAGPADDAIVAALVLRHVLRHTDRAVLVEHWRGRPSSLDVIIRAGYDRPALHETEPATPRSPAERLAPDRPPEAGIARRAGPLAAQAVTETLSEKGSPDVSPDERS